MSHLKHNEGITSHLQRIFIYGDEAAESHRVHSFLEFLTTRINPFTEKPYDLGERSLYRYIGGEMHFPVDLMPALVSWSLDEKLMSAFNIYPVPSDDVRMLEKIEKEEAVLRQHQESIDLLRSRLVKPMGKAFRDPSPRPSPTKGRGISGQR
jgi:hypothetical protein